MLTEIEAWRKIAEDRCGRTIQSFTGLCNDIAKLKGVTIDTRRYMQSEIDMQVGASWGHDTGLNGEYLYEDDHGIPYSDNAEQQNNGRILGALLIAHILETEGAI